MFGCLTAVKDVVHSVKGTNGWMRFQHFNFRLFIYIYILKIPSCVVIDKCQILPDACCRCAQCRAQWVCGGGEDHLAVDWWRQRLSRPNPVCFSRPPPPPCVWLTGLSAFCSQFHSNKFWQPTNWTERGASHLCWHEGGVSVNPEDGRGGLCCHMILNESA